MKTRNADASPVVVQQKGELFLLEIPVGTALTGGLCRLSLACGPRGGRAGAPSPLQSPGKTTDSQKRSPRDGAVIEGVPAARQNRVYRGHG